jgi:hypothetical protein
MVQEESRQPVECRSDDDYAGRPLAIHWQGRRCIVERVVATWRTPDAKYYRVITQEGTIFDCCYSASVDAWTVFEVERTGHLAKNQKEPK